MHVPIVDQPSPDGIRSPDPAFQRAVDERLEREVAERGRVVLKLDPGTRPVWLEHVEQEVWLQLRPAQLRLL